MNEIINVSQSTMLEALNRSEVDMQISTAKAYPRDVQAALTKIETLAKMDKETAEQILQALEQDEKDLREKSQLTLGGEKQIEKNW